MLAQMSHKGSLKALDPEAILRMRDLFIYIFQNNIKILQSLRKKKMNNGWNDISYSTCNLKDLNILYLNLWSLIELKWNYYYYTITLNSSNIIASSTYMHDFLGYESTLSNLHMRLTAKHVYSFLFSFSYFF